MALLTMKFHELRSPPSPDMWRQNEHAAVLSVSVQELCTCALICSMEFPFLARKIRLRTLIHTHNRWPHLYRGTAMCGGLCWCSLPVIKSVRSQARIQESEAPSGTILQRACCQHKTPTSNPSPIPWSHVGRGPLGLGPRSCIHDESSQSERFNTLTGYSWLGFQ